MIETEAGRRPRPVLVEGVENSIEVDRVIVAIGHAPEITWMGEVADELGDERGWIEVNDNGETGVPGVFAGGDLVNNVADAISAIADGLRAVEGITRLAERGDS
jgi:glutamate synthase (NADPH/NADH) small chain